MKVSKKGEYALLAVTYLSHNHESQDNEIVPIQEIARNEKIPLKFLEGILLTLKKAGILKSKRGMGGGYALNRPPQSITLGEVIRLMDGPLAPLGCASKTAHIPCAVEHACGIQRAMLAVRNAISNVVDKMTFADVCREIPGKKRTAK